MWHLGLLVLAVSIGAQVSSRSATSIVARYSALILALGSVVMLL
jgi:hypothetical protein